VLGFLIAWSATERPGALCEHAQRPASTRRPWACISPSKNSLAIASPICLAAKAMPAPVVAIKVQTGVWSSPLGQPAS
jgi:hypothetical protein